MEIDEYYRSKKELYDFLMDFIECEAGNIDFSFQNLNLIIEKQNILKNKNELREFLYLIAKISTNHHRNSSFFNKIEKILLSFHYQIEQTFSNSEMYNIFVPNKKILLFLIKNKILFIDQIIVNMIIRNQQNEMQEFFYPEIKPFLDSEIDQKIEKQLFSYDPNIMNIYEEKRQNGVNDSYLSQIIRNDSIEEFISYSNKVNFSLEKTTIKHSIFETNELLQGKEPTLIQYAAFYSSIQIFQYLSLKKVSLDATLWIFAIHSQNSEMIHLLEENHVEPSDGSYELCLEEAIKCHHNEIANYIKDNLMQNNQKHFSFELLTVIFQSFNFSFIEKNMINDKALPYLFKNDYFTFVKILFDKRLIDINSNIEFKISIEYFMLIF